MCRKIDSDLCMLQVEYWSVKELFMAVMSTPSCAVCHQNHKAFLAVMLTL